MPADKKDASRAEHDTGLPGAHADRARKESPDATPPMNRVRHGRVVGDVMMGQFELCNPDTEVDYAARMMVDEDCTIIPVVEDTDTMKPIGVVTARDIVHRVVARGEIPSERHVRDCMSSDPVIVKTDTAIQDAIEQMKKQGVRRALVVDEKNRLCGIFLGDQK